MQSTESGTLWGNENAWKCEFNFSSRFQCCPTLSGRGGNITSLALHQVVSLPFCNLFRGFFIHLFSFRSPGMKTFSKFFNKKINKNKITSS